MANIHQIDFNPANMSAFGTLETAEMTPIMQGDFVYGLNTQIWQTAVVSGSGAAVDTNASRLRIQSGTSSSGYAYIQSARPVRYRAGQGTTARFTPLFTAGAANSIQLWGMGTITTNAPYDGYFFGYNGTSFGVARYAAGSGNWTAQTSWNGDKCDGSAGTSFTLDPAYGTPSMIKYPYLGYGDVMFYLQNPASGAWVLVHTIQYANTTATTQITNPTLNYLGYTLNSGNTTNLTMHCASVGVFISGVRAFTANPRWAADAIKNGITTEAAVLSVKNCTTYNGVTNRGLIRLNSISIANSGAATTVSIRLKVGVTLGGSPSWTTVNGTTADLGVTITSGNSIATYDVAGTTVASGTYIYNLAIGPLGTVIVNLAEYDLYISPAQVLTVSAQASASSNIGVALNWSEDI